MEGEEAKQTTIEMLLVLKEGINRSLCSSDDFFITYKWIGIKLSQKK